MSRPPRTCLLLLTLALASCATEVPRDKARPTEATYITRAEIEQVNASPGTDRNIRVIDIGHENFAVGVVHRGKTVNGVELDRVRPRSNPPKGACGLAAATDASAAGGLSGGITHDSQTEAYYILSGSGRMYTGGHLENGRLYELADLNGPTCIGIARGVTMHDVSAGDVVVIPAGVVHGWAEVPEHVDYLAFRPSPGILAAGWIHPVLRARVQE